MMSNLKQIMILAFFIFKLVFVSLYKIYAGCFNRNGNQFRCKRVFCN